MFLISFLGTMSWISKLLLKALCYNFHNDFKMLRCSDNSILRYFDTSIVEMVLRHGLKKPTFLLKHILVYSQKTKLCISRLIDITLDWLI